jgi:hypothetical protein
MIDLLAALALQTQTILAIPETCGDRSDCAMVLIEPRSADTFPMERDTDNDQLEPYSQSLTSGASRAAWRWQIEGRLDGSIQQPIELRFFTRSGACRETTSLYLLWPFLGFTPESNPVFLTDSGELEVTGEFPTVGRWDQVYLASLTPDEDSQPILALTEYEGLFFDSAGEIYARQGDDRCVRLPVRPDRRLRAANIARCTYQGEGDPRYPFPLNAGDLEITFDGYLPFGVERLPDHVVMERRISCT